MPASLSGPTKDQWWNAGAKYIRSGASRGTTTASGLLVFETGFPREVHFVLATDQASNYRLAAGTQTQSTFYTFHMASANSALPTQARLQVLRKVGGLTAAASFTLAASVTGVTARWVAFGF